MPAKTVAKMAKILPDADIHKLIGKVILGADENRLNPNGIEIRLGKHVLFHSTDEEQELGPGMFLKVRPGESVTISSYERFVFTREEIHKVFPGCDLMALVTPTTTMMREGIMQAATKVDSGWTGTLNWGLRNSSVKDFILGYGEPIFKLTIFLLEPGETPQIPYGERKGDKYQNTDGVVRSTRTIPADIPKKKIISSSVEKLDPQKQLREAGYPFDHISTELADLHGKFQVVSTDVMLLKNAIAEETQKLLGKVDESRTTVLEKVENLFNRRLLNIAGTVVGTIVTMYGGAVFLENHGVTGAALGWVAVVAGLGCILLVHIVTRKR